jgi:hypothetical protein
MDNRENLWTRRSKYARMSPHLLALMTDSGQQYQQALPFHVALREQPREA